MRLVPADYVSDEDREIQYILNRYPLLKYRVALLLSSYRELCTMSFEAMQKGETDTADGWISLSKKDTRAKRLGIPLFEGVQDWTLANQQLEELREDTENIQWKGLREALDFQYDIERARGRTFTNLSKRAVTSGFPLEHALAVIEKYEQAIQTFLGEEGEEEGEEA